MPRKKKLTVLRLRQKLREVRTHPKQELIRFVHKIKTVLDSFVSRHHKQQQQQPHSHSHHSSTDRSTPPAHPPAYQPQHHSRTAISAPELSLPNLHDSIRLSNPLPLTPRATPPGYQSIRCVTPSEHEEGLHDNAAPGIPYQQFFPFRSYEDLRQAEERLRAADEETVLQELREARRRASSGASYQRLTHAA
ncbi:hypothetical protein K490DRAFT_65027 [Saccharata proteae CBS 121410]|uniref:Uncharacterized protein n=1 Tax=Saccharata proteae CBS 121410 TaxID=1314787 RepID=A0A9P4LZQ4_9PEZI|nr:hypothetical protein K490DRAFT_65027 [Saccharata proteae CBS 121410]